MVDRPNRPSQLAKTPGLPPQASVDITHGQSRVSARLPTGESVEVLLHGAHIISWKDGAGAEKMWLSDAAVLDGSKAVRGGIPLVFPVFGVAPDHAATTKLPQHGFARTSRWEFLGKSTSEDATTSTGAAASSAGGSSGDAGSDGSVKLDFGLSAANLSAEGKQAWPYEFGLIYSVTLSREGLATNLMVRNEGEEPWEFQVLMHTYLRIDDITTTTVHGLGSAAYIDKVSTSSAPAPAHKKEPASAVVSIASEVDRVYTPAGAPTEPLYVKDGSKDKFVITRDNLPSVVVWNPWIEKAKGMGDFEPKDGYKKMICVEAGSVNGWLKLDGGESWEGGQLIRASL